MLVEKYIKRLSILKPFQTFPGKIIKLFNNIIYGIIYGLIILCAC